MCGGNGYACGSRLSDNDGDDGVASLMQAWVGTVAGSGADGWMDGWTDGGGDGVLDNYIVVRFGRGLCPPLFLRSGELILGCVCLQTGSSQEIAPSSSPRRRQQRQLDSEEFTVA